MSNVDGVEVVEISIKRGRHVTRGIAIQWPLKRKWLDLGGSWSAGEPRPLARFHEAHAARMGILDIASSEQNRERVKQQRSRSDY
ncbi:MAG: hypothetical protein KDA92_04250 [Planctomycetales bacterium]|nr:hypothetical protein [Planctomycetales bacterium]